MSIAIELESERGPGWHTQIAEAILLVDKIEIVMEAAPRVIFKKVLCVFLSCHGLKAVHVSMAEKIWTSPG